MVSEFECCNISWQITTQACIFTTHKYTCRDLRDDYIVDGEACLFCAFGQLSVYEYLQFTVISLRLALHRGHVLVPGSACVATFLRAFTSKDLDPAFFVVYSDVSFLVGPIV